MNVISSSAISGPTPARSISSCICGSSTRRTAAWAGVAANREFVEGFAAKLSARCDDPGGKLSCAAPWWTLADISWRSGRKEEIGMAEQVALVTGGLRGLGRAMSLGLAKAGHEVVAVGHIESDVAEMEAEADKLGVGKRLHPLVADLREADGMRPRRRRDPRAFRPGRYPRQQCRAHLHLYRPGAVPPRAASSASGGRRRDRRQRHHHELPRRRPAVAPGGAGDDRASLGPHRQRDDQARHDEPGRHASLWRVEGGARNGDRGMGQGRGRYRA